MPDQPLEHVHLPQHRLLPSPLLLAAVLAAATAHLHRQSRSARRTRAAPLGRLQRRPRLRLHHHPERALAELAAQLQHRRRLLLELPARRRRRHVRCRPPLAAVEQLASRRLQVRPLAATAPTCAGRGADAGPKHLRQRARLEPVRVEGAAVDDAELAAIGERGGGVGEGGGERGAEQRGEPVEDDWRGGVHLARNDAVEGAQPSAAANRPPTVAVGKRHARPVLVVSRPRHRGVLHRRGCAVDERERLEAARGAKRRRRDLPEQPRVIQVVCPHNQQRRRPFERGARGEDRVGEVAPDTADGADGEIDKVDPQPREPVRRDALGDLCRVVPERDHRPLDAGVLQASQEVDHERPHVDAEHALAIASGQDRRRVHEGALDGWRSHPSLHYALAGE
mmetsp:Transcript_47963/g.155262  ORF Transcript_47963/g.155262 Transcript_47963/m.155262 type:complete len:395 (-) Transcript_47963:24-1208(-)